MIEKSRGEYLLVGLPLEDYIQAARVVVAGVAAGGVAVTKRGESRR